jgi:hypothetical protein
MSDYLGGGATGGPKYKDHLHDFKASVFGYSAAGVLAMLVIHSVVLSNPDGHQKWLDVVSAGVTTPATK